MWLTGIKLWVHGGEGVGGRGSTSVLGDTWSFDIYTQVLRPHFFLRPSSPLLHSLIRGRQVWVQYGTSDDVPWTAHMPVQV